MKLFAKLSALGAVVVFTTAFASATVIQLGSYGTGTSDMGNGNTALAGSTSATAPSFAYNNGMSYQQLGSATTVNIASDGSVWAPAQTNSSWVSFAQTGPTTGPAVVAADGNYFFTSTFDIGTTATPGDAGGSLSILADDTVAVFLNGNELNIPTGDSYPHCSNGVPTCIGLPTLISLDSSDFVSGVNTLTFQVVQANAVDFGVDFSGSVSTVPEPSSLILLGTGLLGSAGALMRKMRS